MDSPSHVNSHEERCIRRALELLEGRVRKGPCFSGSADVRDFARIRLAHRDYEVFAVMWLDTGHRMIEFVEMFRGTLSHTSVYPRELVRDAIRLNAAACILTHNHPSGTCTPSRDDEAITRSIKGALAMIDVRVLDHVIVAAGGALSMAEHGLM